MTNGEHGENSKNRRKQNRKRVQQISLASGVAKSADKVSGRETSPISSFPVSSSSSSSVKIYRKKEVSSNLWSEAVEKIVRRKNEFKANFRVNPYNTSEAYCTIEGVPMDILINGEEAQNRAIEGDVVLISVDPVSYWTRLKGVGSDRINVVCDISDTCYSKEQDEDSLALARISDMINSNPLNRPTGRVLEILKRSPKRASVIGFLSVKDYFLHNEGSRGMANRLKVRWIDLNHTDPRFPKMLVSVANLPNNLKERMKSHDITIERDLVGAEIYEWNEDDLYPHARVIDVFGRGDEIEPRISAILFENSICAGQFSPESLACLPDKSWKIHDDEFKRRKDLRNICSFTIDPSSAIDLDDAFSVEVLSDEVLRIGVHIADVSYFVLPDTALDAEAQARSTSVYILQHKLSMLPPDLSENLCSLLPGEDRLAFSVMWDINVSGKIIDRWIGRSTVNSCCKLSYDFVQDIIDKSFDVDEIFLSSITSPVLHGHFSFKEVIESLRILHEVSGRLRKTRFNDGALQLETIKFVFLFDEYGIPYDSMISERTESCCLVEEFMLLANISVAEVITQAFPDSALLRRHPEPILRKLKEFEAFCSKHGFELDTSSAGQLNLSLLRIKEEIKKDPVLFDIVVSQATKPMQSAMYFCTGDLKGRKHEWAHYSLNVPLYTHFTSPIRRYPDIIVHRMLCAALDADQMYQERCVDKLESPETEIVKAYFTGLLFDKQAAESTFGREALSASLMKFKIPGSDALREIIAHCNDRNLASRRAEDAGEKLYLWALLKKKVTPLVTEARVLALGPKFMSVYIQKFGMERRIYYDNIKFLNVKWLIWTERLVLDLAIDLFDETMYSHWSTREIEEAVFLTDPSGSDLYEEGTETICFKPWVDLTTSFSSENNKPEALFFPLVLQNFSFIPVVLHPIGRGDGPIDIGAKLYACSYFR